MFHLVEERLREYHLMFADCLDDIHFKHLYVMCT